MQNHTLRHMAAVLIVLCAALGRANAQFSLVWDNGGNFVFPASNLPAVDPPDGLQSSGEIHYMTGKLTNTSGQTLYVNSASWYPLIQANGQGLSFQNNAYSSGPYFTGEITQYLLPAQGIAPGQSFTGPLSLVTIDGSTAQGLYDRDNNNLTDDAGVITIDYFDEPTFAHQLGTYKSPHTSVTIGAQTTVPEPSALLLALPVFGLCAARSARVRKRRCK